MVCQILLKHITKIINKWALSSSN